MIDGLIIFYIRVIIILEKVSNVRFIYIYIYDKLKKGE